MFFFLSRLSSIGIQELDTCLLFKNIYILCLGWWENILGGISKTSTQLLCCFFAPVHRLCWVGFISLYIQCLYKHTYDYLARKIDFSRSNDCLEVVIFLSSMCESSYLESWPDLCHELPPCASGICYLSVKDVSSHDLCFVALLSERREIKVTVLFNENENSNVWTWKHGMSQLY